jgi:hypothetical protein
MTRTSRIITTLTATLAALVVPAGMAMASVPPAPAGERPASTTTIVTHSSSGVAVWAVVLIAVGCAVVGAATTAFMRSLRHRAGSTRGLATA